MTAQSVKPDRKRGAALPKRTRNSQRYTAAEFKPYVAAIGQFALAWNDLQESLAGLFWSLNLPYPPSAGDSINYLPLRVWHSIKSDRSQRDMLQATVKHLSVDWGRPRLVCDANWLIDQSTKLEGARNDTIHSPLFSVDKSLYGSTEARERIAPAWWQFNPKAISLMKRENLLGEFRYCRDVAIMLSDYARQIDAALINRLRPWPSRPSLPNRKPKNTLQGQPHQPPPKQHSPPPPPSQA